MALLNLPYFEDFCAAVDLSENGSIMLHLRNGTVLARYPRSDDIVGLSFAKCDAWQPSRTQFDIVRARHHTFSQPGECCHDGYGRQ